MENSKCLLIFYSGTNNTTFLVNKVKDRLLKENYDVDVYRINPLYLEVLDLSEYSLIGISYPIYGFNVPVVVDKFFRKQRFQKDQRVFIFKNSGETYSMNDSSSLMLKHRIKRCHASLTNEYHFMMPYNIHFRFDEKLVKEMLTMDELLLDILIKEIKDNIPNIKKYKLIPSLLNYPMRLTYIGGNINVLFYTVKKDKCIKCGKCINGCQMKNIYFDKDGKVKFHHHCLMCMNCTLNCPTDAIKMGLFNKWRVNKPYDLKAIESTNLEEPIINENTKGFFKCYIKSYKAINERYSELFDKKMG